MLASLVIHVNDKKEAAEKLRRLCPEENDNAAVLWEDPSYSHTAIIILCSSRKVASTLRRLLRGLSAIGTNGKYPMYLYYAAAGLPGSGIKGAATAGDIANLLSKHR